MISHDPEAKDLMAKINEPLEKVIVDGFRKAISPRKYVIYNETTKLYAAEYHGEWTTSKARAQRITGQTKALGIAGRLANYEHHNIKAIKV